MVEHHIIAEYIRHFKNSGALKCINNIYAGECRSAYVYCTYRILGTCIFHHLRIHNMELERKLNAYMTFLPVKWTINVEQACRQRIE